MRKKDVKKYLSKLNSEEPKTTSLKAYIRWVEWFVKRYYNQNIRFRIKKLLIKLNKNRCNNCWAHITEESREIYGKKTKYCVNCNWGNYNFNYNE